MASDPAVARAYRTAAGLAPTQDADFLIDGSGRLRYAALGGWTDPAEFAGLLGVIGRDPPPSPKTAIQHHHAM